ncbi:MAG: mycofactocin system glycosyltransferase [Pseudonocardiaceae bacterium]|nr:mycofactocin system glycosyltransferase [Pseudonocardiaceae bacterium]
MTRAGYLRPPPELPGPVDERLPLGFTVQLDDELRWLSGDTLLGGAPPRILRLSPTALRLLVGAELVVRDPLSGSLARKLLDAGAAHPRLRRSPARPVSVVIPVRDRPFALRRLVAALAGTPDLEIIVVDDGSVDGAAIADAARGARVIRHEQSRGPAAARNTGLAVAGHEFVAFLDSDVVPEPGWLHPLLAHFDDPAVALAAPRIVGLGDGGGALAGYERARSSLDLGPREAPVVPRTRVAYVPSAAVVLRASAVPGGFAGEMRVAEDVDQVCRLHAAGWRMRYEPAARVAHEHRDRLGPWLARKAFYGTGAAPLALRHPDMVPPVNMPAWAALACVLLGTQRRWGVLAAAAVSGVGTVRMARSLRRQRAPLWTALRLNAWAVSGALWQSAGALTRHWWPIAGFGSLFSKRLRRALVVAALAEGLADWVKHRGELDPARYLVLHRLDDLAYGWGLWQGALGLRTSAPLVPRLRS